MNTVGKTLRLLNYTESDNGGDSGSSTPSEEYRTPTFEAVPLPGSSCLFDFPEKLPCTDVQGVSVTLSSQNRSFASLHSASMQPLQPLAYAAAHQAQTSAATVVPGFSVLVSAMENTRPSVLSANLKQVRPIDHDASQAVKSEIFNDGFTVSQESVVLHSSSNKSETSASTSSVLPLDSALDTGRLAGKKTATFAPLPNQTTWMRERVLRSASDCDVVTCMANNETVSSSQLVDIKMRLEERRHQIESEKRRMAAQWKQHRQQVGNDAFVQVVSKSRPRTDRSMPEGIVPVELSDSGVELERQAMETLAEFEQNSKTSTPSLGLNGQQYASFISFTSSAGRAATVLSESAHVSKPVVCQSAIKSSSASTISSIGTSAVSVGKDRLLSSVTTSAIRDHGSGKPAAASRERVSDYGTSLDRLNSSLMELQGEIMRLSLQQDQIKSLVGPDADSSLGSTASAMNSNQFYFSQTGENQNICSLLEPSCPTVGRPVEAGYLQLSYMPYTQYSSLSTENHQQAGVTDNLYSSLPSSDFAAESSQSSQLDGLFHQSNHQRNACQAIQSLNVIDVSQSLAVNTTSATFLSSACTLSTPISSVCASLISSSVCSPAVLGSPLQSVDEQLDHFKGPVASEASTVSHYIASVPNTASNEAFFMTFDDLTPRRPKPVLGLARNARSKMSSGLKTLPSAVLDNSESDYAMKETENCELLQVSAVTPVATVVGFKIAHSEAGDEMVGLSINIVTS